jgi:hypothetical protein
MHRVELKDILNLMQQAKDLAVPNAPCGVESTACSETVAGAEYVPNAPCGVERKKREISPPKIHMFLMHRVELKVWS